MSGEFAIIREYFFNLIIRDFPLLAGRRFSRPEGYLTRETSLFVDY